MSSVMSSYCTTSSCIDYFLTIPYTLDDKPYVQVVALFVGKVVQQNAAEGADASQYQLL